MSTQKTDSNKTEKTSNSTHSTRRDFLQTTAAGSAALAMPTLFHPKVLGANAKINIGAIGVGGRGAGDLAAVASENIVALCDVDEQRLKVAGGKHPSAKQYFDYRELLEQDGLDAVVVATPDHHHAPASIRAMKKKLHVYCEKPLTHTVEEARLMTKIASEMKVATQMGTQRHEAEGYIRLVELIRAGAIGDVKEVHIITDRPGKWWPQGLKKPTGKHDIPKQLKWDLWLGPAAERDYHPAYVPFKWRGWWDFGCGAIGDMAIHLMDPAFWALELGGKVKVTSTGSELLPHCAPTWMKTHFEFGERTGENGKWPAVDVFWYEGTAKPDAKIAEKLPMNGSLYVGDRGHIAITHDGMPKLVLNDTGKGFKAPEPHLPRSPGHHKQWIEACKNGTRTGSNFQYAGPFTEVVLLGNVAFRVGKTIEYDPATGKSSNEDANKLLTKEYRDGWST